MGIYSSFPPQHTIFGLTHNGVVVEWDEDEGEIEDHHDLFPETMDRYPRLFRWRYDYDQKRLSSFEEWEHAGDDLVKSIDFVEGKLGLPVEKVGNNATHPVRSWPIDAVYQKLNEGTSSQFDNFMNLLEERVSALSSPLGKEKSNLGLRRTGLPKSPGSSPNREGTRYDNNMVGMRGKYFKRLDRQGSMLSKRDRKAAHPRERLKLSIRQLGKGRKKMLNPKQEKMLSKNGERSLRDDGQRKRLNSKTGATMQRRGLGAEVTG